MSTAGQQEALITATFSRRMNIRLGDDRSVRARVKGKRLRPVCGDRVLAEPIPKEPEWLITEVLPRSNALARPDSRGRAEVLAANLELVVVVTADPPTPDWFVVDRYLAAAALLELPAAIAFNKIDLGDPAAATTDVLDDYDRIGYATVLLSAKTGRNLDRLEELMRERVAIIVGQSGVGKSSIINRLVADAELRIGELSAARGEGRHTTVNSVMLDLPNGGAVIDSPGVRDYAPATESTAEVTHGYVEIAARAGDCRFANCRHLREPGCAVKAAVASGEVSPRRYESYKRLQALTRRLLDGRA